VQEKYAVHIPDVISKIYFKMNFLMSFDRPTDYDNDGDTLCY